jgi:hypothetical protein
MFSIYIHTCKCALFGSHDSWLWIHTYIHTHVHAYMHKSAILDILFHTKVTNPAYIHTYQHGKVDTSYVYRYVCMYVYIYTCIKSKYCQNALHLMPRRTPAHTYKSVNVYPYKHTILYSIPSSASSQMPSYLSLQAYNNIFTHLISKLPNALISILTSIQ